MKDRIANVYKVKSGYIVFYDYRSNNAFSFHDYQMEIDELLQFLKENNIPYNGLDYNEEELSTSCRGIFRLSDVTETLFSIRFTPS